MTHLSNERVEQVRSVAPVLYCDSCTVVMRLSGIILKYECNVPAYSISAVKSR